MKSKRNVKKLSQAAKMKLKSEMEATLKELIPELDKEILLIQINELEGKLTRKMHLCSYMEEEMSIYKTLYSGKMFLKSESMKLLNEAFQDFACEIFLLHQEYESMKSVHSNLCRRHHFCLAYQKRVNVLSALGKKLEENLMQSEKCSDELPVFVKAFFDLEEKASAEKAKYDCARDENLINFFDCLLRIQDEVNVRAEDIIRDKDLKLGLLPLPWQALFCSRWLDSSIVHLDLKQEAQPLEFEMDVTYKAERRQPIPPVKKNLEVALDSPELDRRLHLHLKTQNLHQQNKVRSMKSEIADLERALMSLEISGETCFEKSYLIQIVHKAGMILKQQFG